MKFRDLLNLNQDGLLPNRERVYKRIMKRRARPARIAAFVMSSCAVLTIGVFLGISMLGRAVEQEVPIVTGAVNIINSIEAIAKTGLGVKTTTALEIKTSEEVELKELKARLAVSPEAKFNLKKTGTCAYELRFEDALQENTLYNVEAIYNGKAVHRWAFQTESVFKVTNATPEGEHYVNTDSAVEVTFSHADVSGFEEAFQIVPKIEGSFEHYGRTWAFVPSKPFDACKLYTVTIKKEVAGPGGIALDEDYRFSFTTVPEGSYAYLIYQQNEAADTFLVNESPIASICYNQADVSTASVKVYSLANSKAYIDAYKSYVRNGEVSPEIMALADREYLQFEATPAVTTNYNNIYEQAAFINYPEALPLGYYFAEIQIGGYKVYQLLESTTLSLYTITTNGDYSVWVNDTESGEPIPDRKVTLDGFRDAKTNSVGVATFKGAEEALEQRVLTVENGAYPYVAFLNGGATDEELNQKNAYYSYITTGSNLYRATDTAEIFGVVLPRKAKTKIPDKVTLRCDSIGVEMQVEVAKNGTFTAELPLNNTAATYGNVDLLIGKTYLTGTYFNVADYELPLYQVEVTTERLAYTIGEEVRYTAQVTYMDGTPAGGIPLSSSVYNLAGTTDEDGCLTGSFYAEKQNEGYYADTNGPEIQSVEFSVDNGTDGYYGSSAAFMVFDSKYFLKAAYEDGTLTVNANQIDFNLADQLDRDRVYSNGYSEENFKGAVATLNLTGELHEITYEKKPLATTYDAINKKVVYSWKYEEKDTLIRNFDLSVTEGAATLELPERSDEGHRYYVVLHSDAGTIRCDLSDYNYYGDYRYTYNLNADKFVADIGEAVELSVLDGRNNETINGGSVLYTAVSGEVVDNFHGSSGRYTMKFKKEYAPDVMIYGAYFDGRHIYDLGCQLIDYDLEKSRLYIEMEKDKPQYSPGDKVTLQFKVTDGQGKPVQTALNLSVLDRALYLLTGDFSDPLYELYGSRCFGSEVYTTTSHREFMPGGQQYGEGGGGGEISRGDFEDAPYFETVETNKNGEATVQFTLPDSITEWKVVARAVSEDIQAGMDVFELRSTQNYFAQASMSETIKTTDDLTIAVKADGLQASRDEKNYFTIGITDRDGNEIKTLEGSAEKGKYVYLNFGKLREGVYTAYIQAENGALKDGVIKSFQVESTQSSVWIHDQIMVDRGLELKLKPARGNVTLTMVDVERAFWQQVIGKLKSHAGNRVDQVLGQYLANEFYSSGVWMNKETLDYSLLRSYMDNEGVKLFTDRDVSDLRVSAKMAAVAPDFFDREVLKNSFEWYLNDRYAAKIDVLVSYFGLAALGEPVLNDLQLIYSTETKLSPEENAYLALGFAYAGDYNTARYIFDTRLKSYLVESDGTVYAAIDESVEEDLTGCLTLLSNRLSLEYSKGLISYIVDTDTEYTLLNLELISYLNDHVTELNGENKVTVTTGDGRNETYTYSKMGELILNLSPAQASDLRIVNLVGESSLSYAYSGTVRNLQEVGVVSGSIGVEIPSEVDLGGMAQILLDVSIPEGYDLPMMDLTLPSGLRFESGMLYAGEWECNITPALDQKRINIPLVTGDNTISIWIRGALPGEYELEPIVVTNAENHSYITTDSVRISVVGT